MKIFLILSLAVGPASIFGQAPINTTKEEVVKLVKPLQNDSSVITTIIVGGGKEAEKTAFFLNDRLIEYSLLVSMNAEHIKSLTPIYSPIEIDSVKFGKQIRLVAKNNYFPKATSLFDLKNKYFPEGLKNEQTIFMIDNNIIHGDYYKYEIDENNLYAITLDNQNEKDKVKLHFLKLTTKSEASIYNFKYGYIWMERSGVTLVK